MKFTKVILVVALAPSAFASAMKIKDPSNTKSLRGGSAVRAASFTQCIGGTKYQVTEGKACRTETGQQGREDTGVNYTGPDHVGSGEFDLFMNISLDQCADKCTRRSSCYAYEYMDYGKGFNYDDNEWGPRCELWKQKPVPAAHQDGPATCHIKLQEACDVSVTIIAIINSGRFLFSSTNFC